MNFQILEGVLINTNAQFKFLISVCFYLWKLSYFFQDAYVHWISWRISASYLVILNAYLVYMTFSLTTKSLKKNFKYRINMYKHERKLFSKLSLIYMHMYERISRNFAKFAPSFVLFTQFVFLFSGGMVIVPNSN